MAMGTQTLNQRSTVDTFDRLLAGGVDVGDDHLVGLVECRDEFIEQGFGARIPMGLKNRDNPSVPTGAGSGQSGFDLHRVMRRV